MKVIALRSSRRRQASLLQPKTHALLYGNDPESAINEKARTFRSWYPAIDLCS